MTLNLHEIDGLPGFEYRTISTTAFEQRMKGAGYEIVGSAPARGHRVKVWWTHKKHRRVESIYSRDGTVITAYHPYSEDD